MAWTILADINQTTNSLHHIIISYIYNGTHQIHTLLRRPPPPRLRRYFRPPSANIQDPDASLSIKSEQDLAAYLRAILGHNTPQSSQQLKDFIAKNELSVLTAAEEVVLILTDEATSEQSANFDITSAFIKNLGDAAGKVKAFDLSGKSSEEVE